MNGSVANRESVWRMIAGEVGKTAKLIVGEFRPRGRIFTPFNVISVFLIVVGIVIIVYRLIYGLGSVTNLSQEFPWGIWIGFDVMVGVAFGGGAYVITFVVYVLGTAKYKPIVRATILNGFLSYAFYAGALLIDLGRPWRAPFPFLGYFGVSSVLFLVAWHFVLYTFCLLIEFSPVIAEWLGWRRIEKFLKRLTIVAVIIGVTLSTLHQAGLGGLFLLAKGKLHPLWYSPSIGLLFFVSSIFAGLSLVIIEGTFTHKMFAHRLDKDGGKHFNDILIGLGKGTAIVLFLYLFLKVIDLARWENFTLLGTPMGHWYLLETVGFVLVPMLLFAWGAQRCNVRVVKVAAFLAAFGIILNRLNVSVIAFQWYEANRYVPSWQEVEVSLAIICAEIWALRWIINRMPVMGREGRLTPPGVSRKGPGGFEQG